MPEVRLLKGNTNFRAAFWQITETEEDLYYGLTLTSEAKTRLSSRKSLSHRRGYLAIRQLLKQLNIEPKTHQYDALGAPYLTDGRFLSLSHTKTFAAVVLSDVAVGIDIENYQEKIVRIAPRFLHASELTSSQAVEDIPRLTQIWTAKEAIYKALRIPGIHFSTQMEVQPFQAGAQEGKAFVYLKEQTKEVNLQFFYFQDHCASVATFKTNSLT